VRCEKGEVEALTGPVARDRRRLRERGEMERPPSDFLKTQRERLEENKKPGGICISRVRIETFKYKP